MDDVSELRMACAKPNVVKRDMLEANVAAPNRFACRTSIVLLMLDLEARSALLLMLVFALVIVLESIIVIT